MKLLYFFAVKSQCKQSKSTHVGLLLLLINLIIDIRLLHEKKQKEQLRKRLVKYGLY